MEDAESKVATPTGLELLVGWIMHEYTLQTTVLEPDPWLPSLGASSSKESQILDHLGASSPVVYVSPHIITLAPHTFTPKTFANMHYPGAGMAPLLCLPTPLKKGSLPVIWGDGVEPFAPIDLALGISSGGGVQS